MQVAVQPLWRQSQPDTLVLLWQPTVPEEHCWQLALLWRLTHIATSRVIASELQSDLIHLSLAAKPCGLPHEQQKGDATCLSAHFSQLWGSLAMIH